MCRSCAGRGKGHQRTLFDEVVRVPLIVSWPGRLKAGRVVTDQVRLIDVMPTLLSAAGAAHRPPMQGRDLTPLLLGGTLPAEPALSELLVDGRGTRALRARKAAGLLELARTRDDAVRSAERLARAARRNDPDEEILRRLRNLGYVGGGGGGGADDDGPPR